MGKTLRCSYLFHPCLFFMASLSVGWFLLLSKLNLVKLTVTMRVLPMNKYPLGHLSTIRAFFFWHNRQSPVELTVLPGIQSYLSQTHRNGQLRVIFIAFWEFRYCWNMHYNTCWRTYGDFSLHPSLLGGASYSELERDHLGPVKREYLEYSGIFGHISLNPNKNISSVLHCKGPALRIKIVRFMPVLPSIC